MNTSTLLSAQWESYPRYHQSRRNLLLHIALVPLFWVGNFGLVVALVRHSWLALLAAVLVTGISLALQGRGHRKEPVPAEPFTGPVNALSRIFLEQWVTFPRFVISGGWLRALRQRRTP